MAVSVAELRARYETDLANEVLQRVLDANVLTIDRSAGLATPVTENKIASNAQFVSIRRPAVSIDTVTERRRHSSAEVTLAADDYRLVGPYRLLRVTDGTNGAFSWGDEVAHQAVVVG